MDVRDAVTGVEAHKVRETSILSPTDCAECVVVLRCLVILSAENRPLDQLRHHCRPLEEFRHQRVRHNAPLYYLSAVVQQRRGHPTYPPNTQHTAAASQTHLSAAACHRHVDAPPPVRPASTHLSTKSHRRVTDTSHTAKTSPDTTMHIHTTARTALRNRPARGPQEQEGAGGGYQEGRAGGKVGARGHWQGQ
jgi:hypothetical protein